MGDRLVSMPLLTMDVAVEVDGIMASTRLTQRFDNRAARTLEAIYVFPLPERAALHHMEVRIGERRIISRIKEREEAKQVYEKAKSEGRKAALVEQERANLFTTSVGNLNPGEAVEVILEYIEEVRYEDGRFGLGFPLTFTPRYVPAAQLTVTEDSGEPVVTSSVVDDAGRITPPFLPNEDPAAPRATFRATLRPGFPLAEVRCRSHAATVTRQGDSWTITPAADTLLADRDLVLEWSPETTGESLTTLLTRRRGEATHGLLLVIPPEPGPKVEGFPTRTLFVIDISGSMAGPSIVQARRALDSALQRLRPTDSFNILAFNQGQRLYREAWVPADPLEVAHARGWVDALQAEGGTEIHAALLKGVGMFDGPGDGDVTRIIFLTDGAVGNEAQVLQDVTSRLGAVRVHAVGIGPAPNRFFIRKLAEQGHGLSTFIFDTASLESATRSFLERVERPVLSELRLDAGGAVEMYPATLPDLHAGEPLFVSLRWEGPPPPQVLLDARSPEGAFTRRVQATAAPSDNAGLSIRWARAKVEDLTDSLHRGADPASVRRDVVAVGIEHHLVTWYTSLVAVEERVTAEGPSTTVNVANALPHGSELLGSLPMGGTLDDLRRLVAMLLLVAGSAFLWFSRAQRRAA